MLNTEQFLAANKSSVESFFALSTKAFEGVEKLVALNMQVGKATLAEAAETTGEVLALKDPAAFTALQQTLAQSASDKATAYGRQVYDIVSTTAAVFTKAAEGVTAEGQEKLAALVDSAMKSAPAGSEQALSLVKSTFTAANEAYESAQKAAKQAAEAAEANFTSLSTSLTLPKAAPAKSRRAA